MKKGLCRRKEEGSSKGGGRNNGGLRPPKAHGSGGTSVAHAFGQQLHTAQHVGSESRSQNREPPCRSGGPDLVGICKMLCFFFSFPLSLKLCADSHVGELIKPHVLPDGSQVCPRRPAGGAAASLMRPLAFWGTVLERT